MRDDERVRTTLEIDDDVLLAAKEMAAVRGTTAGKVLSELARKGLDTPRRAPKLRNGVPVIARLPGEPILTVEMVNELLNEE